MKRELKFRYWDMDVKKMGQMKTLFLDIRYRDSISIMQFTGLKDKNGVDIYEGDIITPTTYKGSNMAGFKCQVIFKKGMFCFKQNGVFIQSDTPLCNSLYFGDKHGNKFEIIGNIYENTELLSCPHTTDLK